MSHKEEDEIMDDVSQHENPTMNIPLQEAVYALIANMQGSHYLSQVSHGESSRTTLPPVKDLALSEKKRRFGTDDVAHSQENEKKKKEDHKPRNEQDPLGLMSLSDVDDDSDQENVRKKQEDQKLRMEHTERYSEKVSVDMEEQIGSLTCSMNAVDLSVFDYPDSDNQDEDGKWVSDYATNISRIGAEDNDDPGTPLKELTEEWSHLDTEIVIFECMLVYRAKKMKNPLSDNSDLADLIKNWLHIDVPVEEFRELMQFLKMKYAKRAGKRAARVLICKNKVDKVLELAHGIWG